MKEIIQNWREQYSKELEDKIIAQISKLKFSSLTGDVADLLALAISDNYNNLAKNILEKEYLGKKIDLNNLNQFLINQSEEKHSLLHFTAQFGNKDILLYFLDNKMAITLDKDQMSPIHCLCFCKKLSKHDFIEILNRFNEINPELINQKDLNHLTPLHYAAYNDNKPMLEALVACGAKK